MMIIGLHRWKLETWCFSMWIKRVLYRNSSRTNIHDPILSTMKYWMILVCDPHPRRWQDQTWCRPRTNIIWWRNCFLKSTSLCGIIINLIINEFRRKYQYHKRSERKSILSPSLSFSSTPRRRRHATPIASLSLTVIQASHPIGEEKIRPKVFESETCTTQRVLSTPSSYS